MKTSSEIKAYVIERLEARDPMALYFEFFNETKEDPSVNHIKSVVYKWQCACREIQKERGWNGIDETFPKSIICYNAYLMSLDDEKPEHTQGHIKDVFGWDVKAVADGNHCNIAQIIINVLQENFIKKQKERLGLAGENKED